MSCIGNSEFYLLDRVHCGSFYPSFCNDLSAPMNRRLRDVERLPDETAKMMLDSQLNKERT